MGERNYKKDNKSFMIYKDWEKLIDVLDSDEQVGQLLRALFGYAKRGEQPNFEGALMMAFIMMSQQIERDGKKWEETCERRVKSANKRWESKEEKENASACKRMQKDANACKRVQKGAKGTDTVTVTVKETETATVTEKEKEKDTVKDTVTETYAADAADPQTELRDAPPAADSPSSDARTRFVPPSLEEVQKYCFERKNGIDPQRFVNFYESNGWKVGKNPMKDWKASVRTWEQREFDNRSEGNFTGKFSGNTSGNFNRDIPQTTERSYDLEKWTQEREETDYSNLRLWD